MTATALLRFDNMPDMGRRRGQRTGTLEIRAGSWFQRWREDAIDITGRIYRAERGMAFAPATGPNKIGKREAERIAYETILSKLDNISTTPTTMLRFDQFVEQRFRADRMPGMKASGRDHYNYCFSEIMPTLGAYRLRDISPVVVLQFFAVRRTQFSAQTLKHFRNAISAVFRYAKKCGMWTGDIPTDVLELPKTMVMEKRALTAEQVGQIIGAMPGQYSTLVALLVVTGMRFGEAAALKWSRVDAELTISENYSHGAMGTTKGGKTRNVPMPMELLARLRDLRGDRGPEDTVFVTTHGNPLDYHSIGAKFLKPTVRRLGLPWVSWHTFRHTYASLADGLGMTVAERMRQLGHSSDAMALRYTHADMERLRVGADAIAAAVRTKETVQ